MDDKDMRSVLETIQTVFPDKTLVDIDEYEDKDHQTYKYLYETSHEKVNLLSEELFDIRYQLEDRERELAELNDELTVQKSVNEKLNNTTMSIMEFVKKFTEQEIVVSCVKAVDRDGNEIVAKSDGSPSLINNVSDRPGIYESKRPSWFTPLKNELNKENAAKKSARNTKHILLEKLLFWKNGYEQLKSGKASAKELADQFDLNRKNQIIELLRTEASNEEKYLKYILLTPGISRDYLKTLIGASEIGLNANVIIELLEQPIELFNKEVIEFYVSEAHKGTEYNLKKELAEELVRGDWYVSADINGKSQKFQLVPFELLEDLKDKLNNICMILSDLADATVCANLAQTVANSHEDEETISDFIPDTEESLIEFDDSMLDT
ncbi:MAG: hypothetical protein HDQ95_16415 [Roseburia sp.]|nr:hypothetical protein [Roseburia sp.]